MMRFIIIKIIVLLLVPSYIKSAKLNVPRVLLHYNHDDIPSNFNLKVYEGGCYKWTSSREEVLLEELHEDSDCSNEAIVSVMSKSPTRLTAIILAKDMVTGFSLRCDVIVDSIYRLEIVTTTRELYAEEAPEVFEVRAYDHQGNEFSTLEGQTFVWDLQTITDHKAVVAAQTVLRFITFEASPYETPPAIAPLEARGEQGNMVLIEGRQTGLARLSVRMAHPAYKDLPPAEVNLMVIANLILEPQDVYILPKTTVEYSVFHLKQGVFHHVEIEGSQYYLQVSDMDVAQLEQDGISVTGLSIGTTSVILQDNNVKSSETLKQPTASLHVVDPSYLTITIFPHNNPALIVGNPYTFVVQIYDKKNNKIFVTDNIIVETTVPSEFITTEFMSKNGTYIEGIPVKKGSTKITAKLPAIEVNGEIIQLSPQLKTSLSLEIYDKIRVLPPVLVFPWDPITRPRYKFNLTVEGAHGEVVWSSSDTSLVEVNTLGQCHTKSNGRNHVVAALSINPQNNDKAMIYVEEVLKMNILDDVFEVEIGQNLPLRLALSTVHENSEVFFTQCHQLPLRLKTEETIFSASEFKPASMNNSCVSVELSSRVAGFSKVVASYQSSRGQLEDSVTIGAFKPLKPKFPQSGETVLALGTSRIILFEGGPLPWINKPNGHFSKVEYDSSSSFAAEIRKKEARNREYLDIHPVYVECNELGEFDVTIHVGNKPSTFLPNPVQVSSSVKVICGVPDVMSLNSLSLPMTGCPTSWDTQMVIAPCYKHLPVEVVVRDSEGRKFDNISSLATEWSLSDKTLVSLPQDKKNLMTTQTIHGFHIPLTAEQSLIPFGLPGEVTVKATITGYKHQSLGYNQLTSLQDSIKVIFVKDAELHPSELVLFNHKENKGEVLVTGGSGHFELPKEDTKIATFEYVPQKSKIIVTPMSDGNISLSLRDLCLEPASTPSALIRISSLGSLDLRMKDRVEVGMTTEAEVLARDTLGNQVPVHSLMKIMSHPHSDIIDATYKGINEEGNAVFSVHGKEVGDTVLKMSCKKGSSLLYSPSRPIQVFPSLAIYPNNLTLIVGAVFQVETVGGPYPDSSIEFLMDNSTISAVSYAGVVTALSLGVSRLTARAISQYKNGEELIVYSKDSAVIHVVSLGDIHIHAPLHNIETGSTMPLYALGSVAAQNPLAYATAIPPLLFEWSVSNKQIASITTLLAENGIVESKENQGVVRFKALKTGRVTVSLKVSVTVPHSSEDEQIVKNVELSDRLEIKVFESLKLKTPKTEDAKILLSPNSETKIMTNRDSETKLSYKVECSGEEKSSSVAVVTVTSDGVVKAGNNPGDASIMISIEEHFGVTQTIALLVEVRPVSYFEINPGMFMKVASKNYYSAIPVGISQEVRVNAHDNRGRIFTATNVDIAFRPSRFDLIDVRPGLSNQTLRFTIRDMGETVLHVWDKNNPHINDFVKVASGPGIYPDKASVPFGSFVCFLSSLRSINGEVGIWKSENSGLEMDSAVGVGMARQVGKVSVSYQVADGVAAATELYITPIQKISVNFPTNHVSNYKNEGGFFIGVVFEGENGGKSPSQCFPQTSLSPHIPFVCILSMNAPDLDLETKNVFSATPSYVPGQGFGCLLESLYDSDYAFATSGAELLLGVSVIKFGLQEQVEFPMTPVPFHPAAVFEKVEVTLTDADSSSTVTVQGNSALLESFNVVYDEKYVTAYIDQMEDDFYQLSIVAKDIWAGALPLGPSLVQLISSLTLQKIEISVNFEKLGSDVCPSMGKQTGLMSLLVSVVSHYQTTLLSALCLVVTFICLVFGYYTLVNPGYKQTQNASVFASSPTLPQMGLGNTSTMIGGGVARSRSFAPFSSSPSDGTTPLRRFPQSPQGQGISLWSVDQEPVYGDPLFRSSPRPAYDGSPTYSRTPPSGEGQ